MRMRLGAVVRFEKGSGDGMDFGCITMGFAGSDNGELGNDAVGGAVAACTLGFSGFVPVVSA